MEIIIATTRFFNLKIGRKLFVEFQRSDKIKELSCENATQVFRYMNALLEKISSLSVQEVCSASGFFHGCLKIHSAQIQSFLSHMRV